MPKKLYNKASGHCIQNKKDIGNRHNNTGQWQNWQRTRQNKSRRFTRIYLTFHTFIQQEEIQEITRKT